LVFHKSFILLTSCRFRRDEIFQSNRYFKMTIKTYKPIIIRVSEMVSLFLLPFLLLSQPEVTKNKQDDGYPIQSVNINHVKLTDNFWLPMIKKVQKYTIPFALNKCEDEGRMDNFLIAGGKMKGETRGQMPFDDTDLYKIIEGASNTLISKPDTNLESLLDTLIAIIQTGQETDGYITTWRTINPAKPPAPWVKVKDGKRWESLGASHELYNAGHLYEAASTHYIATGKRNFLDIALKNADLIVNTFGNEKGKIHNVPGHQIIETGLIKLYQVTGNQAYLNLSKYFLDHRGHPSRSEHYGPYSQDHIPVTEQNEVVGHAVRAVYMYAAMTDIATIMKDTTYKKAVHILWENMVSKKTYLTGGIGSRHDGEAFGENYELPNLTAYNETCAAIGSVYWNHRLHKMTGHAIYYDLIERTLYNGLISGLSLDAKQFFYPNALESDGKYTFNRGACSRQSWFDCSCCPTNLIRFLPAVPGLIYTTSADTIFVNLFVSNKAAIQLNQKNVTLTQTTDYPWKGDVKIDIKEVSHPDFVLKVRLPLWLQGQVMDGQLYQYTSKKTLLPELKMNGKKYPYVVTNGYMQIIKKWNKNDQLHISLPMEVNTVVSNDLVTENRGKVALEYGPLVYALEESDNKNGFDELQLSENEKLKVVFNKNLLGGINTISNKKIKAIPYYAWSNRGVGKMKVWLEYNTSSKIIYKK
jgi:DUF1680 family protein